MSKIYESPTIDRGSPNGDRLAAEACVVDLLEAAVAAYVAAAGPWRLAASPTRTCAQAVQAEGALHPEDYRQIAFTRASPGPTCEASHR